MFEKVIGNDTVKIFLEKLIVGDRVPHLMLFSGPDGVGKKFCAELLAKEWLQKITPTKLREGCVDIHILGCEGKIGMHSMQSIQEMIEKSSYKPYEAGGKVFIIDHAERMLPSSANALLKTIEEPSKNTLIILVTSKPEKLLTTIRSRSQLFRFGELNDAEKKMRGQNQKEDENVQLKKKLFETIRLKKGYIELLAVCDEIHKAFDEKKKNLEKEFSLKYQDVLKEMNAGQKHKIEAEVEGAVHSSWLYDIEKLLQDIYAYFRDLVFLACVKGEEGSAKLMHDKSYYEGLGKADIRPLDKVAAALSQTKLALERSMPLKNALESLFLSLNL